MGDDYDEPQHQPDFGLPEEMEPMVLTAEDKAVVKYMYDKVPTRIGNLHGMEVICFYADDAVNVLLDSPWATGNDAIFTTRQSVVDFCHELLCKEQFHRANLAKRKSKPGKPVTNDTDDKKSKKAKQEELSAKEDKSAAEDEKAKPADDKKDEKKKMKKLKLLMSDTQEFEDGRAIYVWIYERTSWKNTIIGCLILFGLVAACCYPLWPPVVRDGVYYLSLGGAGFLGVIIFLAIFRYVVYYIIYGLTFGKHKVFLFPNLTEDCGFFESFVPAYEYSYGDEKEEKSKSKKSKTSKSEAKANGTDDDDDVAAGDVAGDVTSPDADDSQPGDDSTDDFEVIKAEEQT